MSSGRKPGDASMTGTIKGKGWIKNRGSFWGIDGGTGIKIKRTQDEDMEVCPLGGGGDGWKLEREKETLG